MTNAEAKSKRRSNWIAAALFLAAGAFFVATAGSYDFYSDEFYHSLGAQGYASSGLDLQWDSPRQQLGEPYTRGRTFTKLLVPVGTLFGFAELPLRAVSLFFGLATVMLGWTAHRAYARPWSAGYLALALFSVSSLTIFQYARMYATLGFISIATVVFAPWLRRQLATDISRWRLLAVALALSAFASISVLERWQLQQVVVFLFAAFAGGIYWRFPKLIASRRLFLVAATAYAAATFVFYVAADLGISDWLRKVRIAETRPVHWIAFARVGPIAAFILPLSLFAWGKFVRRNPLPALGGDSRRAEKGYFAHAGLFGFFMLIVSTFFVQHGSVAMDYRFHYLPLQLLILGTTFCLPALQLGADAKPAHRLFLATCLVCYMGSFLQVQAKVYRWIWTHERSDLRDDILGRLSEYRDTTVLSHYSRLQPLADKNRHPDYAEFGFVPYEVRSRLPRLDGGEGHVFRSMERNEVHALIVLSELHGRRVAYLDNLLPCYRRDDGDAYLEAFLNYMLEQPFEYPAQPVRYSVDAFLGEPLNPAMTAEHPCTRGWWLVPSAAYDMSVTEALEILPAKMHWAAGVGGES